MNMLAIVVASRGGQESIYVGRVTRELDLIRVSSATMIMRYEQTSVAGLSRLPSAATRTRIAHDSVLIPLINVVSIIECGPDWENWTREDRG